MGADTSKMSSPSSKDDYNPEQDNVQQLYGSRWINIGENQKDFPPRFQGGATEDSTIVRTIHFGTGGILTAELWKAGADALSAAFYGDPKVYRVIWTAGTVEPPKPDVSDAEHSICLFGEAHALNKGLGTLSVDRLCRRTSNTCTISFYSHTSPLGRGGNTGMGGDPAIQKIEDQLSAGTSA
jgi:hypothetical protein